MPLKDWLKEKVKQQVEKRRPAEEQVRHDVPPVARTPSGLGITYAPGDPVQFNAADGSGLTSALIDQRYNELQPGRYTVADGTEGTAVAVGERDLGGEEMTRVVMVRMEDGKVWGFAPEDVTNLIDKPERQWPGHQASTVVTAADLDGPNDETDFGPGDEVRLGNGDLGRVIKQLREQEEVGQSPFLVETIESLNELTVGTRQVVPASALRTASWADRVIFLPIARCPHCQKRASFDTFVGGPIQHAPCGAIEFELLTPEERQAQLKKFLPPLAFATGLHALPAAYLMADEPKPVHTIEVSNPTYADDPDQPEEKSWPVVPEEDLTHAYPGRRPVLEPGMVFDPETGKMHRVPEDKRPREGDPGVVVPQPKSEGNPRSSRQDSLPFSAQLGMGSDFASHNKRFTVGQAVALANGTRGEVKRIGDRNGEPIYLVETTESSIPEQVGRAEWMTAPSLDAVDDVEFDDRAGEQPMLTDEAKGYQREGSTVVTATDLEVDHAQAHHRDATGAEGRPSAPSPVGAVPLRAAAGARRRGGAEGGGPRPEIEITAQDLVDELEDVQEQLVEISETAPAVHDMRQPTETRPTPPIATMATVVDADDLVKAGQLDPRLFDWASQPLQPGKTFLSSDPTLESALETATEKPGLPGKTLGDVVREREEGTSSTTVDESDLDVLMDSPPEPEPELPTGSPGEKAESTGQLTVNRDGYQRYKGEFEGEKFKIKLVESVEKGTYKGNQRQRRKKEWVVTIGGKEVGGAPSLREAKDLVVETIGKRKKGQKGYLPLTGDVLRRVRSGELFELGKVDSNNIWELKIRRSGGTHRLREENIVKAVEGGNFTVERQGKPYWPPGGADLAPAALGDPKDCPICAVFPGHARKHAERRTAEDETPVAKTEWHGLPLFIEYKKGDEREQYDGNMVEVPGHYGYFPRTEARDGDAIDFIMGDSPSDVVYIIAQTLPDSDEVGQFKAMLDFESQEEAEAAFAVMWPDLQGETFELTADWFVDNGLESLDVGHRDTKPDNVTVSTLVEGRELVPADDRPTIVLASELLPQPTTVNALDLEGRKKPGKDEGEKVGVFLPVPAGLAAKWPTDRGGDDESPPHFTVLYVGSVPEDRKTEFLNIIEGVAHNHAPLPIELKEGVDWFTSHDEELDAREIAHKAPTGESADLMERLHNDLRRALEEEGFSVEHFDGGFKAHSTLRYCPDREYDGEVPEGGWTADTIEVWGWEEDIGFDLTGDREAAFELAAERPGKGPGKRVPKWVAPGTPVPPEYLPEKTVDEDALIAQERWREVSPETLATYLEQPWGARFWQWVEKTPAGEQWSRGPQAYDFTMALLDRYGQEALSSGALPTPRGLALCERCSEKTVRGEPCWNCGAMPSERFVTGQKDELASSVVASTIDGYWSVMNGGLVFICEDAGLTAESDTLSDAVTDLFRFYGELYEQGVRVGGRPLPGGTIEATIPAAKVDGDAPVVVRLGPPTPATILRRLEGSKIINDPFGQVGQAQESLAWIKLRFDAIEGNHTPEAVVAQLDELAMAVEKALHNARLRAPAAFSKRSAGPVYNLDGPSSGGGPKKRKKRFMEPTFWRGQGDPDSVAYAARALAGSGAEEIKLKPDAKILVQGETAYIEALEKEGNPTAASLLVATNLLTNAIKHGYDAVRIGDLLTILNDKAIQLSKDDRAGWGKKPRDHTRALGWAT